MFRKAAHDTNKFLLLSLIAGILLTPLELIFQHRSSLFDLLTLSTTHDGLGFVVIVVTLICIWALLFLVILFFVWLNNQLRKKDYYQK